MFHEHFRLDLHILTHPSTILHKSNYRIFASPSNSIPESPNPRNSLVKSKASILSLTPKTKSPPIQIQFPIPSNPIIKIKEVPLIPFHTCFHCHILTNLNKRKEEEEGVGREGKKIGLIHGETKIFIENNHLDMI